MADTTFVNNVTLTDADWFSDLNRLHYTIFGDPADDAAARTNLGLGGLAVLDSPITVSSTTATTSGTEKDVTGISSGVKKIDINFIGVSTNGTSHYLIQIGDSGGIENTSYNGNGTVLSSVATTTNYTTGFGIPQATGAGQSHYGTITLRLIDAATNTWSCSGVTTESSGTRCYVTAGTKALSGALTQFRITTVNGTDTFDAGSFSYSTE